MYATLQKILAPSGYIYITVDVFFLFVGRYDLSMPEMACDSCQANWSAGLEDLIKNEYWPATIHFATLYSIDIFYSFEELKMAAPGLSCQAFLRMLDQRTVRFGRVSIEVFFNLFKEDNAH